MIKYKIHFLASRQFGRVFLMIGQNCLQNMFDGKIIIFSERMFVSEIRTKVLGLSPQFLREGKIKIALPV